MNRILIGTICFALLVSCNNGKTNTENDQTDVPPISTDNKKVIELAGKLHGEWISDNYLKNIETSKSVYLSREYDTKLLGFHLDKENLPTDSASLEGFLDHEGIGGSPIRYDERNDRFIQDMARISGYPHFPDPFELNYDGDKIIAMYFPKSKSTDKYRKIDVDLDTELRKILIAGNYKAIDGNSGIRLDSDGKVHGFKDFKYYKLMFDFLFSPGIEFDTIFFFRSPEGGNWSDAETYKFEVAPNALRLQHVEADWDELQHEIDDTVLVLERDPS